MRQQLRAVFFSWIVLVSMIAGGVAFPGTATAQTGVDFQVSNAADRTVDNGTQIDLSADVDNVGNESGTQTVSLTIGGSGFGETDLNLSAGGSETVTFQDVETGGLGPGDYTYTVASPSDSASGSLTVQSTESGNESDGDDSGGDGSDSTAEFQVSNAADRTVDNGTQIDLSADVDNVGNGSGTQTVSLSIDGSEANQTSLTLSAGGNDTVTFQGVDTGAYGSGDHTYTIASANDSAGGSLTVQSTDSGDGGDGGDGSDSGGDDSDTTADVNRSASSVTPTAAEPNESRTYSVTVRVDDTSLANDTGEVDVRFEEFALDAAGNGTDLTIEYTADDVTDGTLTVSESVNATAPATNGTRDVDVTDLRRDTGGGTEFLIEDANATIGTIAVSESETSDDTVSETTTLSSDAVGTQQVDVAPSDLPGDGSSSDPHEISNASELQAMEDDLDANYELVADIDASGTAQWNNSQGFDPVGGANTTSDTPGSSFSGTFDGNGHTITGLTIARTDEDYVGLFGNTSGDSTIESVIITYVFSPN